MRYAAEGIVVLGLILLAIAFLWVAIVRPLSNQLRKRRAEHIHTADWTVDLDYDPHQTLVGLYHPEEGFDVLYKVEKEQQPWDYDEQLMEARLKAQQIADSRNRRLTA